MRTATLLAFFSESHSGQTFPGGGRLRGKHLGDQRNEAGRRACPNYLKELSCWQKKQEEFGDRLQLCHGPAGADAGC